MKKRNKKERNKEAEHRPGRLSHFTGPKELIIGRGRWPEPFIEALNLIIHPAVITAPAPRVESLAPAKNMDSFLAELATGLWRLRQKMVKPGTDQPLDEVRKAFRHLESTWDLLVQEGVEVKDFTNAPFNSGMMLKVVSYEETPGLSHEVVVETIKPTVLYNGRPVQIGEVIVGTPAASA